MSGWNRLIAEEACRLAKQLPLSVVETVAAQLELLRDEELEMVRNKIAGAIPSPHHRTLVVAFLDRWRSQAVSVHPQSVAIALLTASRSEQSHQAGQSIELVWTGPDVGVVPLRRTEQVILQVIDSANRRLLVVSYAVFNVPRICEALVRAAERGVDIAIVVESPDRIEGKRAYSNLTALGSTVSSHCTLYIWPIEARFRAESGKPGLLHVKCAVADSQRMFVSSANFTEYAFTINMELGLLVTGGTLPEQVEQQFERLIELKELKHA